VGSRQARDDLARDGHHLGHGRRAPLETRGERLSAHELHRQELLAGVLADVEGTRDVAVRDLAREPHLLTEALDRLGGAHEARVQHLQRHGLAQLTIDRPVDAPHPARTEERDDLVSLRQHGGTQHGGTQHGGTQHGGTQHGGPERGANQRGLTWQKRGIHLPVAHRRVSLPGLETLRRPSRGEEETHRSPRLGA